MLQKFLRFLQTPERPDFYRPISAKDFFLLLGMAIVLVVPYAFLLEQIDIGEFDHALEQLMKEYKWLVVAAAIVIAPLIEEPVFRLHLDFKKKSIYLGMGLSILLVTDFWVISVAYLAYLFFLLTKIKNNDPPKLKLIIFSSSAFFALVHLGNFSGFDWIGKFYYIPILVGAQFFIGLILSYIRIRHGIRTAMLFHAAYNGMLMIPVAIFGDI